MDITLGYTLAAPIDTQEQCSAYAAMAAAVNDHNAACAIGDMLWTIEEQADGYVVVEDEAVQEAQSQSAAPTNAELAQQITDMQVALCELYEQKEVNNG